ncbi:MAG: hypothetical protein J7L95_08160 [Prolixibacteraceae bacterium]|nr:hypothetical protein [Prolixibacteraceae bacterium]
MVRNGTTFSANNVGFESDNPVTIYTRGSAWTIISSGAKVKINGEGMGSVQFTPTTDVLSTGDNFIEVQLPAGTFQFKK